MPDPACRGGSLMCVYILRGLLTPLNFVSAVGRLALPSLLGKRGGQRGRYENEI